MKINREYQNNFSEILHNQMYDVMGRERKGKTIIAGDVLCNKVICLYYFALHTNSILDIAMKSATIKAQRPEQLGAVCCTTF